MQYETRDKYFGRVIDTAGEIVEIRTVKANSFHDAHERMVKDEPVPDDFAFEVKRMRPACQVESPNDRKRRQKKRAIKAPQYNGGRGIRDTS